MDKIGVYGGSFNPPHNAHTEAARHFLEVCGLDRLFIIPAGIPPHKTLSGAEKPGDRLAMTRLAFGELSDKVVVSNMELRREGKSYTADTLTAISNEYGANIYLLVGSDMFATLGEWHRPDIIFRLATVVCVKRGGEGAVNGGDGAFSSDVYKARYENEFGARIIYLPMKPAVMSSTRLRAAVKEGADISGSVAPAVAEYIKIHELYR